MSGEGHCSARPTALGWELSVAIYARQSSIYNNAAAAAALHSKRHATRTDARVDLLRSARHSLEQRVRAQRIKISASKVKRAFPRDAREVERRVQPELARERLEDAELRRVRIAHAEIEHPVEAAGAQEGGVEEVGAVRRADDEDVPGGRRGRRRGRRRDAVELGEELRDDAVHDAARVAVRAAFRRDRVELVEEDDAGARVARALEDAADVRFGLADVHVEQLGALDGEEVERARRRDRFGEQRLSGARRPVEQNTWARREQKERRSVCNGVFFTNQSVS